MNDSFLSTTTIASETDDSLVSNSTTTFDDDNDVSTISREPPKPGTGNHGAVFPIQWDKLRLSNGDIALSTGSIGYKMLNRRVAGGRREIAIPWQFGADLLYQGNGSHMPGTRLWLCRDCHLSNRFKGSLLVASGFKAIWGHLLKHHRIGKDGKCIPHKPGSLERHFKYGPNRAGIQDFDQDKQRLVVSAFPDWVMFQNLSFSQATSPSTVAMFQLLRGNTEVLFYTSATSLSTHINASFVRRQDEIRSLLHGAISSIHLSNDLWSSTNNLSFLGIVAHFLDALQKHRTLLLGLPRLWGSHDGANQADAILKVASTYGITAQIGTFTMDNASNNDTMMAALSRQIPSINSQQRLRCAGHIINLVVKAILYGDGITEFNKSIIGCSDSEAFKLWRRFGAIGKVHNTVKYIMRSDQRRQHFITLQGKDGEETEEEDTLFQCTRHLLVKDGGVRWNSTYYMLYRAIQLQTPIQRFQNRVPDASTRDLCYSPSQDKITADDWEDVREYLRLLGPFVEATRHLEGNAEHGEGQGLRGSLWEVFIWLQLLYTKVEKRLERLKKEPDSQFKTSLKFGKEKMDEYWSKMIYETPYYYASIILHPDHGIAWFERHWKGYAPWIKEVKTGMRKFVILFGERLERAVGETEQQAERIVARKLPDAVIKRREEQRLLGLLDSDDDETFAPPPAAKRRELELRTQESAIEIELNSWYRYRLQQPVHSPLQFWIEKSHDKIGNPFPGLTKLALDIYSIPAMSSECERVFSQTKRVITDDRNCLSASTIQAIQCQKNWLANKVVHSDLEAVLCRAVGP